jgi:microcystin-dependent protein
MGEPFIEVRSRMFGGNFAPAGWAFCNGATMPISGERRVVHTDRHDIRW